MMRACPGSNKQKMRRFFECPQQCFGEDIRKIFFKCIAFSIHKNMQILLFFTKKILKYIHKMSVRFLTMNKFVVSLTDKETAC